MGFSSSFLCLLISLVVCTERQGRVLLTWSQCFSCLRYNFFLFEVRIWNSVTGFFVTGCWLNKFSTFIESKIYRLNANCSFGLCFTSILGEHNWWMNENSDQVVCLCVFSNIAIEWLHIYILGSWSNFAYKVIFLYICCGAYDYRMMFVPWKIHNFRLKEIVHSWYLRSVYSFILISCSNLHLSCRLNSCYWSLFLYESYRRNLKLKMHPMQNRYISKEELSSSKMFTSGKVWPFNKLDIQIKL